ncbi:MAG TPA: hypothetical protein VLB45_05855, partial [Nitrosopumilaceae archaeon]|nr:hypothetical protein [Nitrosopumilaceae archaeon]
MQELVLVLGSVAGACTAVAIDKIPKRRNDKSIIRANPAIKNQIQSFKIEKEILTRTISRLYQQESELSKIQRDKLLLRYQNQLGLVIAKIEKLEAASKHPDLGPLGDGLITLMDQKLSQLDQRLHEISSKITVATMTQPQIKQVELPKEIIPEKPIQKKIEIKNEIQKPKEPYTPLPPIEVAIAAPHKSVELITLTEIPNRMSEFPVELVRPVVVTPQKQIIEEIMTSRTTEPEKPKMDIQPVVETPKIEVRPVIETSKPEPAQIPVEKKIQIPAAVKIPEDEKLEDDDKDIDKI